MKCQILCSKKNKEYIINLSSTELAQRAAKVKSRYSRGKENPAKYFYYFSMKTDVVDTCTH